MPRGPIPTPKAINDLKGDTHGRRRKTVEPVAPSGIPVAPDYLGDIAKAKWNELVPLLESMGIISPIDGTVIEMACVAYQNYRECEEKLRQFGPVMLVGKNKYPQLSPYHTAMKQYIDTFNSAVAQLGLSPSARVRLAVPNDVAKDDTLMSYIIGKQNKKKTR